ncbi:hypothetical protein PCASD_18742 [Puccinia coronata f. sp. avenae]|uniref:Uncharacterized protein n=1 Tax=Puccinia coronata f. sp. avenae TaxID=200324 RepID=A0A2N5TQY5_9BASI|nr:hypothetical protein PCASD_18742 [Puccinia coronata f. sp. avenae]
MNKVVVRSTLANLNDHVIKSSQPVVFSFSSSSSFKLSIRYLLTSCKLSTFVQVCSSSVSPPLVACLLIHLSRSQKVCSSSVSPPLVACLLTHLSRSQKLKSLQKRCTLIATCTGQANIACKGTRAIHDGKFVERRAACTFIASR